MSDDLPASSLEKSIRFTQADLPDFAGATVLAGAAFFAGFGGVGFWATTTLSFLLLAAFGLSLGVVAGTWPT